MPYGETQPTPEIPTISIEQQVKDYEDLRRYAMNRTAKLTGALYDVTASETRPPSAEAIEGLAAIRDELNQVLLTVQETAEQLRLSQTD